MRVSDQSYSASTVIPPDQSGNSQGAHKQTADKTGYCSELAKTPEEHPNNPEYKIISRICGLPKEDFLYCMNTTGANENPEEAGPQDSECANTPEDGDDNTIPG